MPRGSQGVVYQFECSNVMPTCEEVIDGETTEEVLDEVADHMREHHGMIEMPADMAKWVLASVRPED